MSLRFILRGSTRGIEFGGKFLVARAGSCALEAGVAGVVPARESVLCVGRTSSRIGQAWCFVLFAKLLGEVRDRLKRIH